METRNTEYVSGMGKDSTVPPEIRRWNWGAFLLNFFWGIGNRTYIALLMLVPVVNFVMPFVLGAKGSEWAWQNKQWRDVEHFRTVQRRWGIAGAVVVLVVIPGFVISLMTAIKNTDAYQLGLQAIQVNEEVQATLGQDVAPGFWVTGNIEDSGASGEAALQFTLSGSGGEGLAYVYAFKHAGDWQLYQVVVDVPDQNRRIGVVVPEGD